MKNYIMMYVVNIISFIEAQSIHINILLWLAHL